jgi:hypothetical protein
VDPGEQGTGLGRALTLAGLLHMRERGLAEAMLYVDEDNVPAIRLYEALGFRRWSTDAMYRQRAVLSPGTVTPEKTGLAAPDTERRVKFGGGQRPIGSRHRAQHLGVELDLVQGDGILDTKVQLPGNRAHLRR